MARPGRDAKAIVDRTQRLLQFFSWFVDAPRELQARVAPQFEAVRAELVQQRLMTIPIEKVRQTTGGRLRLEAIERAGYRSVGQILAIDYPVGRLQQLQGVGPQTADRVVGAARQIAKAVEEDTPVRLDAERRSDAETALLATLHALEAADECSAELGEGITAMLDAVPAALADVKPAANRLRYFFAGRARKDAAALARGRLDGWLESSDLARFVSALEDAAKRINGEGVSTEDLWKDYGRRAPDYYARLGELADLSLDVEASYGHLPTEIAKRVNAQQLDDAFLSVSLRGYQAFGAKFALVQRKAILGDEMGLGKTVEALAAFGHLRSIGATHFVTVCPASVLVNWMHEVRRHSKLGCYRLHGYERDADLRQWMKNGGVAVTTYESLRSLAPPDDMNLAMLVVDEAHYVKNPQALRTKTLRPWIAAADRVLFLTGTPLENRVDEFRNLVSYLQPQALANVSDAKAIAGPEAFRRAVAPVYLRRNQADVLTELPERLEMEDWVELADDDFESYRSAVASGNFMAMRRAAYIASSVAGSAKLTRLVDIVDESAANGWKVVVFSYFHDVLGAVGAALNGTAMGPLTGRTPPDARQHLVDRFSAIDGHAVLLGQIQAGGTGLNMQAASVVILTEPQWKPTIEEQAIGRCHRMGQIRRVHAHRLLAKDSVDERMLEIIATKATLFDEYVRNSAIKDVSPDAVDISEVDVARQVASQAESERQIVAAEQKRLGLEPTSSVTTEADVLPSD